jgi:integrase
MSAQALTMMGGAPSWQHVRADEYARYVGAQGYRASSVRHFLCLRERFVHAYPDLRQWGTLPLADRVGRLHGEPSQRPHNAISYQARPYLYFLALQGCFQCDWDWLIAVQQVHLLDVLERVGPHLGVTTLIEEACTLGYEHVTATQSVRWALSRLFMHLGCTQIERLHEEHCAAFRGALRRFSDRPDVALFFGSVEHYRAVVVGHATSLHLLHVLLYHRGQATTEPARTSPPHKPRPLLPPLMEATIIRYLAARHLTDRPTTVLRLEQSLRRFTDWLTHAHPSLTTFTAVQRDHVLEYAQALQTQRAFRSGQPLAALTKRGLLSGLSVFFRDTAAWGWEGVPGRPLLSAGDLPRLPLRVPRYIPDEELVRLMRAIRALACPYQRTALLVARWSGARREEIRRLELDCLDSYPDGTPRLRIPAGKMKCERVIPLNEEAAAAIRALHDHRRSERGFRDTQTGVVTRYLFVQRGKICSLSALFDRPLELACTAAGLVTAEGSPTVTAHRFRHTVGTQLAEKGAKLHTIMTILGHTSATMSMVYARISDREVLRDYQSVLGPGAVIAGPCAAVLRSGGLSLSAVDWLQTNFFKTELELGHCLRLPQEGPCECDLYLNCAKFVTTPAYTARLRERRVQEVALQEDAEARGWVREVERHRCTARRIEQLLSDLGEVVEEGDRQG